MKITLEIELDCDNPNGAQIPLKILDALLEDFITASQLLVCETDREEWQLFINWYNITIKEVEDEL